jgi:predicted PurR-regulated permease PerM
MRYARAATALGLMVINKFAVGNGVEAVLMGMGTSGSDEHRRAGHTHPVLMIFIVLVGAKVWGASGTLFAVPATWLLQAYCREQQRLWNMQVSRVHGTSELTNIELGVPPQSRFCIQS